MTHEAGKIQWWRPIGLVAALGASTLVGAGLGISESPSFTSPPDPIAASCLGQFPYAGDGVPGPDQDLSGPSLSQLVEDIHHTDFFATDSEVDHGIEGSAFAKFKNAIKQMRGSVPTEQFSTAESEKLGNEMDAANRQLNYDVEAANAAFLRSKSITVRDATPGWAKKRIKQVGVFGAGPNQEIVSQLEFIPEQIIRASGLREVVINSSLKAGTETTLASDLAWDEPEVHDGVLTIGYADEINTGLAEMILNNCSDKQAILDEMTALNGASPYNYNPNANFKYGKKWQKKYGDVFFDPDSMTSAEVEFIELFSQAIPGWNGFDNTKSPTVLGLKQQLVQGVFNRIVPGGAEYAEFWNFASGYGNPGNYTPNQLATVLLKLVIQINEAPTPQAKAAINQNWDNQF